MEKFYTSHGTNMTAFHLNEEATSKWLLKLETSPGHKDLECFTWIRAMLQKLPSARPTASQVIAQIVDAQEERRFFCFQCSDVDLGKDELEDTGTDLVTGTTLETQAQYHYVERDAVNDSEDTVTAQFLEEVGAVIIASDKEVPSNGSETHIPGSDVLNARKPDTVAHDTPKLAKTMDERYFASCETEPEPSASSSASTHGDRSDPSAQERGVPQKNPDLVRDDYGNEFKSHPGKKATFESDTNVDDTAHSHDVNSAKRFCGLPADRRPRPSKFDPMAIDLDDQSVIAPEPIQSPSLYLEDCYPLPKATLAPSYLLAGANRFSPVELSERLLGKGNLNLFVYGRLMFPSVFRGFAARSTQGTYSPAHQRRLIPSSRDWLRADTSIKRAAEVMTPARLRDFDIWRPSGCTFAVVRESSHTSAIHGREGQSNERNNRAPTGQVMGFLVMGLTEESLRYCDLVFSSDDKKLRQASSTSEHTDQDKMKVSHETPLERRSVTVDVQLSTYDTMPVSAYTYVWTGRDSRLKDTWSPDTFVRTSDIQALSEVASVDWRAEETSLAETMKLNYALVGDEVCAAVLSGDIATLQQQLRRQYDIDARCRRYGTPLQAAIIKGNENMTRFLLDNGADPSLSGGKYGTPLIAATMGSRKSITRLLLKRRVDVFGTDKTHVSALYQAVGHGDWAITEMLLEAGAWLSKDYSEIKDLANEKGDPDLQALLREYDITDAQLAAIDAPSYRDQLSQQKDKDSRALFKSSSRIAALITRKFITLSSEPGSWKGRKGVAVVKAALAAGASPKILEHLRTCINPVSKLIDLLKEADREHEESFRRDIHPSGHVEELDDAAGNEPGLENDTSEPDHPKAITAPSKQRDADDHYYASHLPSSDSMTSRAMSYDVEARVSRRPQQSRYRSPSPPIPPRRNRYSEKAAPSDLYRDTNKKDSHYESRSISPPPRYEPATWNEQRTRPVSPPPRYEPAIWNEQKRRSVSPQPRHAPSIWREQRRRSASPPLPIRQSSRYQRSYSPDHLSPAPMHLPRIPHSVRTPRNRQDSSPHFPDRHLSLDPGHRTYTKPRRSSNPDSRRHQEPRSYGNYDRGDSLQQTSRAGGGSVKAAQWDDCTHCNGVGWYREIWTDRDKYDHVREVDCTACRKGGRVEV